MMNRKSIFQSVTALFISCFLNNAWALGPCAQIVKACQDAGFQPKQFKTGNGIERDCINPIMQNKTVPNAKPLPSIAQNQTVIQACRAKRPKFGTGKVGF